MLDFLESRENLEEMAGMLDGSHCDCWFNKTEVKNSGGWEKTDDSMTAEGGSGSEQGEKDPPRCLDNCREQFLATVSPGYNNETDTETFKNVCSKLTTKGPNPNLWPLYWCDSTLCGVWIDQDARSGQDPNVDKIINQCQDVGYHSVLDPGPPPPNYTCVTNTDKVDGTVGLCSKMPEPSQTDHLSALAQPPPGSTAYPSTSISSWETSVILATQSGSPSIPSPLPTTGAPSRAGTTLLSSDAPNVSATASQNDNDLATGVKAAIAVCSALSLLAALCLALFLLHRRRRHKESISSPSPSLPCSVKDRIRLHPRPSSPTTPLINTTRPPLTPPLRLRDRKLLPSLLRQSRTPSPPLTPLDPVHFPSSPICSPTTSRLVPRHERTPKIYGQNGNSNSSPPPSPLPLPPAYFANDDNRGSGGSTVTLAPSTKSSAGAQSVSVSVSSLRNEGSMPVRPARPTSPTTPTAASTHAASPTSPAGPPPNRALPPRPGNSGGYAQTTTTTPTPVIVVDGASPCPSPEGGGSASVAVGERGRREPVSQGGKGKGMSLDLNFGEARGR